MIPFFDGTLRIFDWTQRTINDYGNFYYGKSAPKWSVTEDATTPCIRYGELYTKFNEKIDRVYSYTNIPTDQLKFSTGREVLVPRVGEDPMDFANCSWLSLSDVAIGEMISVYNTEQNPLFVAQYFNALLKKEFAEKVEGGNVSNLYYDRLLGIPVSFPSVAEQEKIADFFDKLNDIIHATQRKVTLLKQLKAAYLQQMFPQARERVPRVRFEGFTELWVLKGADEIFCTVSDKGHCHLPVLSASQKHGMVLRNEIGIDIKFDSTNTTTYKRVLPGQFVIHLRSFQGGLAYSKIEGITSPAYTILDFIEKDKQFPKFWVDVLRSDNFIKMLESVTYGIRDGRSISFNDFSILKMPYPSHDEQRAIGRFFHSFDSNINDMQSKVNALSKLKSAYLQKMFV